MMSVRDYNSLAGEITVDGTVYVFERMQARSQELIKVYTIEHEVIIPRGEICSVAKYIKPFLDDNDIQHLLNHGVIMCRCSPHIGFRQHVRKMIERGYRIKKICSERIEFNDNIFIFSRYERVAKRFYWADIKELFSEETIKYLEEEEEEWGYITACITAPIDWVLEEDPRNFLTPESAKNSDQVTIEWW
jgi:hypothetical protein